jgi:lysophospholipase
MTGVSHYKPGQAPPFNYDQAEWPDDVAVDWIKAKDGLALRVATSRAGGIAPGGKGSIIIFPGRTEFVEKYGRLATHLAQAGYGVAAIDWRGQGLADRLVADPEMGHIDRFINYQQDVAAYMDHLGRIDLPRPWHLFAYSMGGLIALRALNDGLPVKQVVFSAPMWGINMTRMISPLAIQALRLVVRAGGGERYAPGCGPYTPMAFDTNPLTQDRDHLDYVQHMVRANRALAIGDPSNSWVLASLNEIKTLLPQKAPDYPTLTLVGSNEMVVDLAAIKDKMDVWPKGRLEVLDTGRHDLLIERAPIRQKTIDMMMDHYAKDAPVVA